MRSTGLMLIKVVKRAMALRAYIRLVLDFLNRIDDSIDVNEVEYLMQQGNSLLPNHKGV